MKNYLFRMLMLIALGVVFSTNLFSQDTLYCGAVDAGTKVPVSTTTSNYWPYYNYDWARSIAYYTSAELVEECTINSLAFYCTAAATSNSTNNYALLVKNISNAEAEAAVIWPTTMTTKSNSEISHFEALGYTLVWGVVPTFAVTTINTWVNFEFDTPFEYTGEGLSVVIMHDDGVYSGNQSITYRTYSDGSALVKFLSKWHDGTNTWGTTTNTSKPNMRVIYESGPSLQSVYPAANLASDPYLARENFDDDNRPGIRFTRKKVDDPIPTIRSYKITRLDSENDPLAQDVVVYSVNNVDINLIGANIKYNFTSASGESAMPDGNFRMSSPSPRSGKYRIDVIFYNGKKETEHTQEFYIENRAASYVGVVPNMNTPITSGVPMTLRQRPGIISVRDYPSPTTPAPIITYKIYDAENKLIYTALDEVTNGELIELNTDTIGKASLRSFGKATGTNGLTNGYLSTTGLKSGTYKIHVTFDDGDEVSNYLDSFQVIYQNDIALLDISAPKTNVVPGHINAYYPQGASFPIEFLIGNVGASSYSSFKIEAQIYNSSNNPVLTPFIYTFDGPNPLGSLLNTTASTTVKLNTSNLSNGNYYITARITPISPNLDDDEYNNAWPADGIKRYFTIGNPNDINIVSMDSPSGTTSVNKYRYPVYPSFTIRNGTEIDWNGSPVEVVFERLDGTSYVTVYSDDTFLENIGKPSEGNPIGSVDFSKVFFPDKVGNYRATLKINLSGNTIQQTFSFTVLGGLEGTYTIDVTKNTAGTNFKSFKDAIDALFTQGVKGHVVFELKNTSYAFERIDSIPDFRSKIIGVGPDATITFKPSFELMTEQNPIELRISNTEGYGIRFGQAIVSNASKAAVNIIRDAENRRFWANSDGYITFDGGQYKNILITVEGEKSYNGKGFSSPIYFDAGTKNITIKNCRINGITDEVKNSVDLPLMHYRPEVPEFVFQDNVVELYNDTLTYSAGITMRNVPLKSVLINSITFSADELISKNNIIEGNMISNFGYGIVSIGMGARIKNVSEIEPMYNKDNKFINNYIERVSKAGIFLGFEENATISGNRITNILGTSITNEFVASAGIQAGYIPENTDYLSYNNIGLNFEKNEINNVKSNLTSYGILINQPSFEISSSTQNNYYFPNDKSEFMITNNIIYDISHLSDEKRAGRYGIAISPDEIKFDNSRYLDINKVFVANNTILIEDNMVSEDEKVLDNAVAGILLYEVDNFDVYNNAIYIKIDTMTKYNYISALALRGENPKKLEGQNINNNAYFIDSMAYLNRRADHPNSAVVRFIELDKFGRKLDGGGFDSEYKTIEQWINWTEMDKNSVYVNFEKEMRMVADTITPDMITSIRRMKSIDSLSHDLALNNRGIVLLDKVPTDIDNKERNVTGKKYDIGAIEFEANKLMSDVEVRYISAPAAYRNNISQFNDAEYVMVKKGPVEIKAFVRNNGTSFLSDVPINCTITPGSSIVDTRKVSLAPGEEKEVVFFAGDNKFEPNPFAQWTGAMAIPDRSIFNTMRTTVTPIYNITVRVDKNFAQDEKRANDSAKKSVRFYVPQAELRLVISAENSFAELYENGIAVEKNADIVAGRLNFDTVVKAFGNMAYFQSTDEGKSNFDVFDRKAWEPRSVDYTVYNCVIWSDGDDKSLSYWEKQNLIDFANYGTPDKRTTLIVASQEILRENNNKIDDEFNSELQSNVMRSISKDNGVYDGETENIKIKGFYENLNFIINIDSTEYKVEDDIEPFVDEGPNPGIFTMVDTAYGTNFVAYHYYPLDADNQKLSDNISVISSKMLTRNVVYAAIDWRHFQNTTAFLGGILNDIGKDLIHHDDPNPNISIELVEFNANALGKKVILDWVTDAEYNVSDFEIERASIFNSNVGIFNTIANEKAMGFTNARTNYKAVDENVAYNNQYAYRLKINDFDGSYTYSDEKIVNIEYANGISIGDVTPNPVNDVAFIEYSLGNESDIKISLNDLSGREVSVLFDGTKDAGMHKIDINVANLSSGTYHLIFMVDGQIIEKPTIVSVVR